MDNLNLIAGIVKVLYTSPSTGKKKIGKTTNS